MSEFLLSDFTQATWLDKGGVQLNRIKEEDEVFEGGYRIYVSHQTCKNIVYKHQVIQDTMAAIMDGSVESPCNVVLYKQQVMRLSHFMEEFYYGIHTLDSNGKVKIGKGMNLSGLEYEELLAKLMLRFPLDRTRKLSQKTNGNEKDSQKPEEPQTSKVRGRKRQYFEMNNDQEVVAETASNSKVSNKSDGEPQFFVTKYGWCWYSDVGAQYVSDGQTQGQWHFNPKNCFFEAMRLKPEDATGDDADLCGSYKLDVFHKKELVRIDNKFMDVVFAKLIRYNVAMCVEEDKALHLYSTEWQDIEVYGKIVLERIPLTEIYDLCKKVMQHYSIINQDMELTLMKTFAEYQKKENILTSIMEESLDNNLSDLLDFIYLS